MDFFWSDCIIFYGLLELTASGQDGFVMVVMVFCIKLPEFLYR